MCAFGDLMFFFNRSYDSPYDSSWIIRDALYPDIFNLFLSEQSRQLLDHLTFVIGIIRKHPERILHGHLELYSGPDCRRLNYFH